MATPTPATLEAAFQEECELAVAAARGLGYNPTAWVTMCAELGAAEAARRLLIHGDIQSGFHRLVELGRLELTIEWAVLSPRWGSIFSEQHREAARWRLRQAGMSPEQLTFSDGAEADGL